MNPFKWQWLWRLAEDRAWFCRWPFPVWFWLLRQCDAANGYGFLKYHGDR